MKRDRDEGEGAPRSGWGGSGRNQLEIIKGLTRSRAERVARARDARWQQTLQLPDWLSPTAPFDAPLDTRVATTVDYLLDAAAPAAGPVEGPITLETVRLVANDGTTLVCDSTAGPGAAAAQLAVEQSAGESLLPGDVVLVRRPPLQDDAEKPGCCAVELVGLRPSSFTDGDAWTEAATANALAALKWLAQLLSKPAGLGQLTFLLQCATEGGSTRTGWLRALLLPSLLYTEVTEVLCVHPTVVQRLRRTALYVLRGLSLALHHSHEQMPMPHLVRLLLQQLLASPLFIDGYTSAFSAQAAAHLAPSEIRDLVLTLRDTLRLALPLLGRPAPVLCAGWDAPTAAAAALCDPRDAAAVDGLFVVLHRLGGEGLTVLRGAGSVHPLAEALEAVVQDGTTAAVVQWLQMEEDADALEADGGWGREAILRSAHRPPTLSLLQHEREHQRSRRSQKSATRDAQSATVFDAGPQLEAMRKTYDPYRTKEAGRFMEAAVLAAFAELYGPCTRALEEVLSAWEGGAEAAAAPANACALTVIDAQPLSQRGCPPLEGMTAAALRHTAAYGLPLRLTVDPDGALERARELLSECSGSLLGYVVGRLDGTPGMFPVLLTALSDSGVATAFAMRDGDQLPHFVSLALLTGGGGTAKLLVGDERCAAAAEDPLAAAPHRFLPPGTPALTYVDVIQRLQLQRRTLSLAPHAAAADAALGLWLQHFATGAPPAQTLDGPAPALPCAAADCLREVTDAAPFAPAQVAALNCLTDETAVSISGGPRTAALYQQALRLVEGAAGSGKSAVLHAAGLAKGRQLAKTRQEQQRAVQESVQRAGAAVQLAAAALTAARTLDDVPAGAEEQLLVAAAAHMDLLGGMARRSQIASSPLVVRAVGQPVRRGAPPAREPEFATLLFGGEDEDEASASALSRSGFEPLDALVTAAARRCANAPLGKLLRRRLDALAAVADMCSSVLSSQESGQGAVYGGLLPFLFRREDLNETVAAAAAQGMGWLQYLESTLWAAVPGGVAAALPLPLPAGEAEAEAGVDPNNNTMSETSAPYAFPSLPSAAVELPSPGLRHFTPEQAAGWHDVFRERQTAWIQRLCGLVEESARHTLLLFQDLVYGVAAISQTTRHTVLSTSCEALLRGPGLLPFVWRWAPRRLFVDDFDAITDAHFLTLPAANFLAVSTSLARPAAVDARHTAPQVLLRGLESTPAARTTMLCEAHRCQHEDLLAILRHWSTGSAGTIHLATAASADLIPLAGLASRSAVEGWSHAVPADAAVEADVRAAEFLLRRLDGCGAPRPLRAVFPFRGDAARAEALLAGGPHASAIRFVPFSDPGAAAGVEETGAAVVCLSGLLQRLQGRTGWWQAPAATAPDGELAQRLEAWLSAVVCRVRSGVVVVADRRLFAALPVLAHLERFIRERRAAESNEEDEEAQRRHLWLPAEVGCAVAAFQCPQHYKSRFIATIRAAEGSGVEVATEGCVECRALCVQPYAGCDTPFHACLEPCHHWTCGSGEDPHATCPQPCVRTLPCQHVCQRPCGERGAGGRGCPPCGVTRLTDLACGQWVVSGVAADGEVALRKFPHFQALRCGDQPRPCETPVTVTCARCGTRSTVRCATLEAIKARRRLAEPDRAPEAVDRETEARLLPVMCCRGCVAVLNRVAATASLAGVEPIAAPPEQFDPPEGDAVPGGDEVEWAGVPAVLRSTPALEAAVKSAFDLEARKASLRQRKEALEISSGRSVSEKSLYASALATYEQHRGEIDSENRAREAAAQHYDEALLQRLRDAVAAQSALHIELDALLPRLESDAVAELRRQELTVLH